MGNLKGRVEHLEGGRKGRGFPLIVVKPWETSEEALQRHFAQHPEDKDVASIIINCSDQDHPSAPPPPRPDQKESAKAPGPAPLRITR